MKNRNLPERVVAIHIDENRRFLRTHKDCWKIPVLLVGSGGGKVERYCLVPYANETADLQLRSMAAKICRHWREQSLWLMPVMDGLQPVALVDMETIAQ